MTAAGSDAIVTAPRAAGRLALRHLTGVSLVAVCAIVAGLCLADLPESPLAAWTASVGMSLTAVAAAGAFLVAVYRPARYRWIGPVLAPAGAASLAACIAGQAGGGDLWPWVTPPALAAAAALAVVPVPRVPATLVGAGVVAVATAATTADWWRGITGAVAFACCVAATLAQMWIWEMAERARRDAAAAAVGAERDRFAAELHDIQGHSLQVIVLKSELAARLAATDPDRAVAEMREVEALARDALRDSRDVARGLRPVALATEIANAVGVLTAAGIACHADQIAAAPVRQERLLALVVREATTNMLRHSTATRATITLTADRGTGVTLTVVNDAPLQPSATGDRGGLDNLAGRIATAGGSLTWRREPDHFQVTARLQDTTA
ncbi:sensor histidine kinase [Actinoplanes regularis]|uniref:sensor histidine kinase n=1 Tax=Actinoplanes regularis TaxID=52697 RepID=UPI0015C5E25E|nr:histidine kinase [Actinoplanes regularis]